jgi:hypothetical protein
MHGTCVNDGTVKVFHSSSRNLDVAWGCFGAVGHIFADYDSFDLGQTSLAAAEHLVNRDFSSMAEYAMEMANALHFVLSVFYLKYSASLVYPDEVFAGIAFVGFIDGMAQVAQVHFRHSNGVLCPPRLAELPFHPCGLARVEGSVLVLRALEKAGMLPTPKSLEEGKELALSYIQTCIENNERCDECRGIGGDVHVAAVTPHGFQWKIRPKGARD